MKTVKICLITLMFLLCIKGTHAQITPLPEDSAMWVYAMNSWSYYFIIKVKGDTLLNNVKYSKVYYSLNDTSYSSTNENLHCFIRNDSLKAYVRYPYAFNRDT